MEIRVGNARVPELTKYKVAAIIKEKNVSEQLLLVEEGAKNGATFIAAPEISAPTAADKTARKPLPMWTGPRPTTDRLAEIAKRMYFAPSAVFQRRLLIGVLRKRRASVRRLPNEGLSHQQKRRLISCEIRRLF